jgi:hypothetical protein
VDRSAVFAVGADRQTAASAANDDKSSTA